MDFLRWRKSDSYKRERHPDHPVSSSCSQAWHMINSSIWMGKLSILPGDELASGEIESILVPRWVGDHACTRTPTTPELGAGLVLMNADEYGDFDASLYKLQRAHRDMFKYFKYTCFSWSTQTSLLDLSGFFHPNNFTANGWSSLNMKTYMTHQSPGQGFKHARKTM